jgi:SAM-dependent methyltransferase
MKLTAAPYRFAYYCWVRIPDPLRAHISNNPRLDNMKTLIRDLLAVGGNRDDIYSRSYYRRVDSMASQSASAMVEMIIDEFAPQSAIDVGCGTGAMLIALRARGVRVLGLDYSRSAIDICDRRGLDVRLHDIEARCDIDDLGRFDVAICTEVAEHVKPDFADDLIRELVTLSDQIVFTAAIPGQGGGVDHVNEQPNSYWIEKFAKSGYMYLEERTTAQREELLRAGVARFYAKNLMLFERTAVSSRLDRSPISGA